MFWQTAAGSVVWIKFSGDTCHFCMTPVIPGCSRCWRPKHQEPPLSGNYSCIHLFLLVSFNFFFFLGGEHWLSPAMLGGACPAPANCYCTSVWCSAVHHWCSAVLEKLKVCSVGVGGAVKCYKPGSRSRPLSANSSPRSS